MSEEVGKSEDVSREGVTFSKVAQLGRLFLGENNRAIAKLDRFASLDIGALNEQLDRDIKGVILDVDDCIAPHHGEILDENIDKIREMREAGIEVIVFSNMKYSERYAELEEMGVKVHKSGFAKPDPRGFLECCDEIGLAPEEVVMVGDNLITDGGCTKAGIDLVLVDPVSGVEGTRSSVKRKIHVATRDFYRRLSDRNDFKKDRGVLYEHDFPE
jgi:uncharacterized protein